MQPRWYQQEAIDAPFKYWDRDGLPPLASPLIEIPTGGGKSLIIGCTVKRLCELGCRVLMLTHRSELIEQNKEDLLSVWPFAPVGVVSASLGKTEYGRQITFGGIQTVWRHPKKIGHIDVILIDECHLMSTDADTMYGKMISALREINPDLRLIGYTATPYRLDQGLLTAGDKPLFHSIAYKVSIKRLIEEGFLAPLVSGVCTAQVDAENITVRAGEFAADELECQFNTTEVNSAVADDLEAAKNAGRRKFLVFGVSVGHAAFLRNEIRMRGISCEVITGDTDKAQRKQIIKDFKEGRIECLTSCDVLTTGFNVKDVDALFLVRATKSVSLYVQIAGRGTRTAPGKIDCAFYDYGGNIARHGPIDQITVKEKKKKTGFEPQKAFKICPDCDGQNHPLRRQCVHCGHEFPPIEKKVNQTASKLAAISNNIDTKTRQQKHEVGDTVASIHTKEGKKNSVRLDYYSPQKGGKRGQRICSEFLFPEHEDGTFPKKRTVKWWHDQVATVLPLTCEEMVKRLNSQEFPKVIEIVTQPQIGNPKFTDVIQVIQQPPREIGEDIEEEENEDSQVFKADAYIGFIDDDLPFMRLEGVIW